MAASDVKFKDATPTAFKLFHPHIEAALDSMDYITATFLSERLYYHYKHLRNDLSELSLLLLARCYFYCDKANCVYTLLKGYQKELKLPQSQYLFAQACFRLKKYSEAETALLGKESKYSEGIVDTIPLQAQGYYLLGRICRRTSRLKKAVKYFKRCLAINSLHWGAYSALCDLGADIDEKSWFRTDAAPIKQERYMNYLKTFDTKTTSVIDNISDTISSAFAPIRSFGGVNGKNETAILDTTIDGNPNDTLPLYTTPSFRFTATETNMRTLPDTPLTPAYATPPPINAASSPRRNTNHRTPSNKSSRARRHTSRGEPPQPDRPLRRSARISSSRGNSVSNLDKGASTQKTPRRRSTRNEVRKKARQSYSIYNKPTSSSHSQSVNNSETPTSNVANYNAATPRINAVGSRHHAPIKRKLVQESSKSREQGSDAYSGASVPFALEVKTPADTKGVAAKDSKGNDSGKLLSSQAGVARQIENLRSILMTMAVGYKLMSRFQCKEAVEKFEKLPTIHKNSGWVLGCLGKCHFEIVNYPKCVETYRLARKLEPFRTEGLEYYSTSLWHLKNEVELSFLAQTVTDFDKMSSMTWIVVGNCLSLQKEHDTALKFFRRAIQLDSRSAWGYTLSAHEFVANEDFEKALCGFRQAIGVNARHYNAWYGMGNIYFRQEKYELAAYHFRRALSINPRNTVLYCYLGMALHANEQFEDALENLDMAERLEPTNSLAKYQKAFVYFSLQKYAESLEILEEVRDFAPREASVHFLMGKVCKRLGRVNDAILHFTTTLDLNPKDKNVVKSAIDKLHAGDTESQSDDEL